MDLQRFPHCILCQHKRILSLETLEISVETVQVHRHHVFQGRDFESHNPKDLRLQHLVAHRNFYPGIYVHWFHMTTVANVFT